MNKIFIVNSGLRFILEIVSILILVWIGFYRFNNYYNLVIGIILPVFFIIIWSIFIAPESMNRASFITRFTLEMILFITTTYLIGSKLSWNLGVGYLIFSFFNSSLTHIGDKQLNNKK